MALGRLFTYFLFSSNLLLLLLLLPPNHDCSKLAAAYHINVDDGNSNAIGTSQFICSSVNSSRGTLTFSRKAFINPVVLTEATLALYGGVTIGLFGMLFAYSRLKSVNNQNASSFAPPASSCMEMEEDDFNDEYGIMSRRRIRTENLRAVFNAEKLNASK